MPFFEEKNDLENIDELQIFLKKEISSVNDFERELTRELKEIEDIKSNLQVISSQMESLRRLAEIRQNYIDKLLEEKTKRVSDINIQKCRDLFQMIRKIEEQFAPMIRRIAEELERLYITETHEIFAESKNNQKILNAIDEEARKLFSEIKKINAKVSAHSEELTHFEQEIEALFLERSNRPSKKGNLSFK